MANRLDTVKTTIDKDNYLLSISDSTHSVHLTIRTDDISSISMKKGKNSWYIRVMSRTGYHWRFGSGLYRSILYDHYTQMVFLWKKKQQLETVGMH